MRTQTLEDWIKEAHALIKYPQGIESLSQGERRTLLCALIEDVFGKQREAVDMGTALCMTMLKEAKMAFNQFLSLPGIQPDFELLYSLVQSMPHHATEFDSIWQDLYGRCYEHLTEDQLGWLKNLAEKKGCPEIFDGSSTSDNRPSTSIKCR